jgi:hypothetical protein
MTVTIRLHKPGTAFLGGERQSRLRPATNQTRGESYLGQYNPALKRPSAEDCFGFGGKHGMGTSGGGCSKIVVGSGWWSAGVRSPWAIGDDATRSAAFFRCGTAGC